LRYALIPLFATVVLAQLPPSVTLSPGDLPQFQAEIDRLNKQLAASPGNCQVMNEMARTWAAGRQYPETIDWLTRIADLGVGLDPSRDPLYKTLRGTREFAVVLAKTRAATSPVSTSREAFGITEGDLAPESEAYDPESRRFFFGSMRKGVIVRCDSTGHCARFAEGLGMVLGVKISHGRLWAVSNRDGESALVEFNLHSARLEHRYVVPGPGHQLNDIALSRNGDIFVTDTPGAALWQLRRGSDRLERFLPDVRFQAANGIAVSDDGRTLYVSNYPDGITVVDLHTLSVHPISHPPGLCLAFVDGLYFHNRSLIAIQNGSMAWRVVRLTIAGNRWDVLERGNKSFEGITGGTIAGNDFYYAANIQDEKESAFNPIVVLKIPLRYRSLTVVAQ
jgi:hypothetical protein